MKLRINKITAQSILIKSDLPGSDWVINPYNGCSFGCIYCYAAQIARWQHPDEDWSSYVDIKVNAPQLLKTALIRLEKRFSGKDFGSIFFSSVTDPYQPIEMQYHLTQQCLQVLADFEYEGNIAIQTKSPLISSDIAILKILKNVTIGFTITALDDQIAQFLEVKAPPISSRLEALDKLHQAGISTYAFIGPILPYIINKPDSVDQILDKLEEVGVSEVWFEHINVSSKIKARLYEFLAKTKPELVRMFDETNTQDYRNRLDALIFKVMQRRKLKMGLNQVIYHHNLPKKK